MKTVLPSRREPHLGGLRTLKNDIFSMFFWDVFLKPVFGPILDDFGLHLGMHFGVLWIIFGHDFCKEISHTFFGKRGAQAPPKTKVGG